MRAFLLTQQLVSEHAGTGVVCLAPEAIGRRFRLLSARPTAATNRLIGSQDAPEGEAAEQPVALTRVDIRGVLEQRSGSYDPCAGYTDGHDAIAERLIKALETSDVLICFDTPGGACAGLQEAIRSVIQAKERNGRRITGYVDELCASAGYWWAAVVCDEIFAPPMAQIGSIGARSGHQSVAGALAAEGVETTFFAWPGPGKIAFAPELPLSDLGKSRGERDVALAGEAFAAAVGPRRGLSRDEIVALDADMLAGSAALSAKLIDGVASYDEVVAYALQLAINKEDPNMDNAAALALRSEDDKDKKDDEEMGGMEPDGICKTCKYQNRAEAKFCDQCGTSMAAEPVEPEAEEEEPKDKPGATVASVLGLHETASSVAIKTAALGMSRMLSGLRKLTGVKSDAELTGAVKALVDDAKLVSNLRRENASIKSALETRERFDLLLKLAKAGVPGHARGDLFVDKILPDGSKTTEPIEAFGTMKIGALRGYVATKLKNIGAGATGNANPFNPDANAASSATPAAEPTNENDPMISRIAGRSTATPKQLAESRAAILGNTRGNAPLV